MSLEERLTQLEAEVLTANATTKEILTFDEACMYMGVTRSHLYKLTSTRKLTHFKPNGKMIYFKRDDLAAWLLQNRIATSEEIGIKATAYTLSHKIGAKNRAN